jgi:hypothetical protein
MYRGNRWLVLAVIVLASSAQAMEHGHALAGHQHMPPPAEQALRTAVDSRTIVQFPDAMRLHILANMRDHLLALSEIQAALGGGDFSRAAEISEQRLGMSSLERHGAHDASRYMPPEMARIGSSMHRAASRFATAAQEAEVGGDAGVALKALSEITQACVACHAGFRVQ